MAEDEGGHLGVPEAGLVAKMDTGFQHFAHGNCHNKFQRLGLKSSSFLPLLKTLLMRRPELQHLDETGLLICLPNSHLGHPVKPDNYSLPFPCFQTSTPHGSACAAAKPRQQAKLSAPFRPRNRPPASMPSCNPHLTKPVPSPTPRASRTSRWRVWPFPSRI